MPVVVEPVAAEYDVVLEPTPLLVQQPFALADNALLDIFETAARSTDPLVDQSVEVVFVEIVFQEHLQVHLVGHPQHGQKISQ